MIGLQAIDEQRELVDSFTRPAADLLPISRLREGGNRDAGSWSEITGLGWLGISLGEEQGGIGLGPVEEAMAAEALARHLLTPCFLATVLAGHVAARSGLSELARQFAGGAAKAALGLSHARPGGNAADAEGCEYALFIAPNLIILAPIDSVSVQDDVHWSVPVHAVTLGDTIAEARDAATLALARLLGAATLAGIASQCCDLGVEYAKVREQFGQPIGAFQAVKHHCANMAIAAYGARELIKHAAVALADDDDGAVTLASSALSFATRAARANAGLCIQVHGGIGFSAEADPHHFLKRAHLFEAAYGGIGVIRSLLAR